MLIFLDSLSFIGIFIPGVPILIVAGALAAGHFFSFWTLASVCFVASILGKTVSFESARRKVIRLQRNSPLWGEEMAKGQSLARRGTLVSFLAHFAGAHRHAIPFAEGSGRIGRVMFQLRSIPTAIARTLWPLFLGVIVGSLWHVATLWSTRSRLLFLLIILALAFIGWVWGWTVRRGRSIVRYLVYLARSLVTATITYPPIRSWREHHPRMAAAIHARLTTRRFTGLSLTVLIWILADTMFRLFILTQDIRSDGVMAAADIRTNNLFLLFREAHLSFFFLTVTQAASITVLSVGCVICMLLLFLQRERILALGTLLVLVLNQSVVTLLKNLLQRARPENAIAAAVEHTFSFPSGHAAASVAFYGFLAYIIVRLAQSWKAKISALFLGFAVIFLVDLSRLYLGVHYLSDVLAGNLVGVSALLCTIIVMELLRIGKKKTGRLRPEATVLFVIVAELCALLWIGRTLPLPFITPEVENHMHIQEQEVLPLFQHGTLPLYTETLFSTRQEPIHLILLAENDCLIPTLARAQWSLADPLSTRSLSRAAIAAFLNAEYINAPMTPTFYDSEPHDFGFEKATDRRSIRSRHHLRIWKTSYTTASGSLFVGTASLDTGLKWAGTMHTIDPAIDVERAQILTDLRRTGLVASEQLLPLLPPSLGTNFTGDPFFTDGNVAMVRLKCGG